MSRRITLRSVYSLGTIFVCMVFGGATITGQTSVQGIRSKLNIRGHIDNCSSYEQMIPFDRQNVWILTDVGTILRTGDGGKLWRSGTVRKDATILGGFRLTQRAGWVVGSIQDVAKAHIGKVQGIILRTNDGGRSWDLGTLVTGYTYSSLHGIQFVNSKQGWAVGEVDQGNGLIEGAIFVTNDGGHRWRLQLSLGKDGAFLHAISFLDPNNGWAIGDGVILKTQDGGSRWELVHRSPETDYMAIQILSKNTVVVVGSGEILRTDDGGITWKDTLFKDTDIFVLGVKFLGEKGWAVGKRMGGNSVLLSTTNGGGRWVKKELPQSVGVVRDIGIVSKSVFAVGDGCMVLLAARLEQ